MKGGIVLNINEIIKKKRDQGELSKDEIEYFISEYSIGNIPDYQASSLLMAIFLNGMSQREISDLTLAMANSGKILNLSSIRGIKVDKHSTGGVGDKVTLVLMPLLASLGVPIVKMSGRGLGYTQGTIDKLESIPGFRTNISTYEFIKNVNDIGISIMAQQDDIDIADKKLYALRDVTGTVESIPLIASSIMSKKIAAGGDKFLLEVTCGTGAFMETEERARVLSETMVNIGKQVGKETIAVITNMNQPLGRYCGNALEVMEAIQILKGKGEPDIVKVCCVLGAYMLKLAGKGDSLANNLKLIQKNIDNRKGLEKFKEFIEKQGGDSSIIQKPELLNMARIKTPVYSEEEGTIYEIETKNIGQAIVNLGGGRLQKDDYIDNTVGIEVLKKIGDYVKLGEPLLFIYSNNELKAKEEAEKLSKSFKFASIDIPKIEEIIDVIE